MMRLHGMILVLSALMAVAGSEALPVGGKKPNVLFIMTDQQRFDAMSCAGNKVLKTPNMDRLAREGVMFFNCYSANPVCVPARASLLTGLSCVNVRVLNNGDYSSKNVPDVPTFDSVLRNKGYGAEYYGKWHTPHQFADCYDNEVKVVGKVDGAPSQIRAFQAWLESKGVERREPGDGELFSGRNMRPYRPIELDWNYEKADLAKDRKEKIKVSQVSQYGCVDLPPRVSYAAFTAEETLEALERMKDKPFTLTCSFDPPHPPMVVQEPYFSMYPPKSIPAPESIDDSMEGSPYKERSTKKDQLHYKDAEKNRQMRSIYYGLVREIDDWLGVILDKLDELGVAENTLVVFTSDHGEMLGDHGMHSKMIFYEGSVHVPLLMRLPSQIKAGSVVETPVSAMDVAPTILEYCGMPIPECDGISLRPLIEGKKVQEHDVVSYSSGSDSPNYMIRSGFLKLMMAQDTKGRAVNALYDLKADPLELRNLIVSPISLERDHELAKRMKARLVKWLEKHEPEKADGVKAVEL